MTIAPPTDNADAEPAAGACDRCGAPLADDQEWCVECGEARTLIHRPPARRVPVVIIGLVVAAALAAFVVVLVNLSRDANRRAAPAAATAQAPTPTPTPSGARLEVWPPGRSGWTVVLASAGTGTQAGTTAQQIAANGIQVGILGPSQHPGLEPGGWIVFTGRYPAEAQAEQTATALQAIGQQAVAQLVGRPGK